MQHQHRVEQELRQRVSEAEVATPNPLNAAVLPRRMNTEAEVGLSGAMVSPRHGKHQATTWPVARLGVQARRRTTMDAPWLWLTAMWDIERKQGTRQGFPGHLPLASHQGNCRLISLLPGKSERQAVFGMEGLEVSHRCPCKGSAGIQETVAFGAALKGFSDCPSLLPSVHKCPLGNNKSPQG